MTNRLHRFHAQNFKAFRNFTLEVDGRHLLIYGPNGAGKSSLYWALHTFLESARKPSQEVEKYFTSGGPHSLLNLHEEREDEPREGRLALTFRDTTSAAETTYPVSLREHATKGNAEIADASLASDFITYRYLFRFSNFRLSDDLNIWPLFEKEILPFCVSTSGVRPLDLWEEIKNFKPNPRRIGGIAGRHGYTRLTRMCNRYAGVLDEVVETIATQAQAFYDEHFASDDPEPITLRFQVVRPPSYKFEGRRFTEPSIEFGIEVNGTLVPKPQILLNEAKLTQLALSIRFAASLVGLQTSAIKLLILDDLLISLDMSNRMKVVDILLSETFGTYQKIILTHDLGFFQECKRKIGGDHTEWSFLLLQGNPSTEITSATVKTDIQRVEEYLASHDLGEAALSLRRVTEDVVNEYLGRNLPADAPREFVGLAEKLRNARNRLEQNLTTVLYKRVLRGVPDGHRALIVPAHDSDLDEMTALSQEERGRLKTQRQRLRQLFENEHVDRLKSIELVNKVLQALDRVLNPAAHAGTTPLYKREVEEALELIRELETALNAES